jgi:hypothetical protein
MQWFVLDPARWRIAHIFVRNPLVRISDRIEAAVLIAVVGILLVAVPIAGAIGTAVYESSIRALAAQAPTSHTVTASAIKDGVQNVRFNSGPATVWASWHINGGEHTGPLRWDRATVRAGDQMDIRVNSDGRRVAPPSWPAFHAVAVSVGGWLSCAAACVGGFAILRLRLSQVRLAGWERELNSLAGDDGRGRANP